MPDTLTGSSSNPEGSLPSHPEGSWLALLESLQDPDLRLETLHAISDKLGMSTQSTYARFPVTDFATSIVSVLRDESRSEETELLCIQILLYYLDDQPKYCRYFIQEGLLQALSQNIQALSSMDVGEQYLSLLVFLADQTPSEILQSRVLECLMPILDFFSLSEQRNALKMALVVCRGGASLLPAALAPLLPFFAAHLSSDDPEILTTALSWFYLCARTPSAVALDLPVFQSLLLNSLRLPLPPEIVALTLRTIASFSSADPLFPPLVLEFLCAHFDRFSYILSTPSPTLYPTTNLHTDPSLRNPS